MSPVSPGSTRLALVRRANLAAARSLAQKLAVAAPSEHLVANFSDNESDGEEGEERREGRGDGRGEGRVEVSVGSHVVWHA